MFANDLGSISGGIVAGGILRTLAIAGLRRLTGGEATAMQGGSLVGTVGRVCLAIPADGVGAVAYHAEGKRHTVAARSAANLSLAVDVRVLVTDLRRGVALVEEF